MERKIKSDYRIVKTKIGGILWKLDGPYLSHRALKKQRSLGQVRKKTSPHERKRLKKTSKRYYSDTDGASTVRTR